MFDKLKYNNLIISGSKEIQKAKIQVLRRIIQKIQKLKKSVERKPEVESNKIKLRKCLAIVESAKKIKKFDALTNILLLEKCPNKVVTNSRSTPEEVAIAMLASNSIMKVLLAKIKQELSLNDDDQPTWRKTLIQISKQKIKTQRKKKRKQALEASNTEKKDVKSKKKPKKGKTFTDKQTKIVPSMHLITNDKEVSHQDISVHAKEDAIVENVNETPEAMAKPQKSKSQKTKLKPLITKIPKDNLEAVDNIKKTKTRKSSQESTTFAQPEENLLTKVEFKKSKQTKPQNAFNVSESKNSDNFRNLSSDWPSHSNRIYTTIQPEIKITKVVDPFFVTSTGENYVATAPLIEANNEVATNDIDFNKPKRASKEQPKTFKQEDQKLHPSWAAKQKQRSAVSFQGKRKVFDSSDQKTNIDPANDLHPSWAAKQKLKPSIAAFQGKKIKFEDE